MDSTAELAPRRILVGPTPKPEEQAAPIRPRNNWTLLIYAALYALAAFVGKVPGEEQVFHTIWLPAGIALAALIFCGYRSLPILFVVHALTRLGNGYSWDGAWPSAIVAVARAALGYWLLKRVGFNSSLKTVRDALLLPTCGALVPAVVCAVPAFGSYVMANPHTNELFSAYCLTYVMRSTAGMVATVPILLTFAPGRRTAWLPARKFEFALAIALTTIAALLIFASPNIPPYSGYPRPFLPYPFLVWAALRLDLKGVSICNLIVTVCAVQGTAAGLGPFLPAHDTTSMVIVCVYLSVSTMTTILLCVSRQERRELEDLFIKAGEIERIRLGTELHDDICQQLAGAGFIASLIRERPDMTARDARSHLDHICSEIQRSIQSMRSLARGLSPLGVDKKQLSVALGDLAALSERIYGIECHFDAAGPLPTLDRETTIHLFRITQEAISNAVKHGRATRVEIVARAVPGCLHLRIGDDGLGLPADAREKDGLGFKTMAYRVALMNGSLSIQDHRQAPGVIVACCIPVLT